MLSAISAYLCDLCVKYFSALKLTQRSQRYAEIAEKNQTVVETNFRGKPTVLGLNGSSGVGLEFFLQQHTCFRFAEPFKRCQYFRKIFFVFLACFIFVCDAFG